MLENLQSLGLTQYEAKIYLALVKYGPMSASRISQSSAVPKNRVYDSTMLLERKGFVDQIPGNPKRFRAVNPKLLLDQRIKQFSELKGLLAETFSKQNEYLGSKESILILHGFENSVKRRMREFNEAEREHCVLVGTSTTTKPIVMITRELKNAVKKGVKVRIIRNLKNENEKKKAILDMKAGAKVRHCMYQGITMTISDKKSVWIELPDKRFERININIRNEAFAKSVHDYFESVWKQAIPARKIIKKN